MRSAAAALRVGVRSVTRRPTRSIPIVLVLTVPVMLVAIVGNFAGAAGVSSEDQREAMFGDTDLMLMGSHWTRTTKEWFPPGTTHLNSEMGSLAVAANGRVAENTFAERVDLSSALMGPRLRVVDGTPPRGDAEAAVTDQLAKRLNISLGDKLGVGDGGPTTRVTAIVEVPSELDREEIVLSPDHRADAGSDFVFVSLPEDLDEVQRDAVVERVRAEGRSFSARWEVSLPSSSASLPSPFLPILFGAFTLLMIQGLGMLGARQLRASGVLEGVGASHSFVALVGLGAGMIMAGVAVVIGFIVAMPATAWLTPAVEEQLGHRLTNSPPRLVLGVTVCGVVALAVIVAAVLSSRSLHRGMKADSSRRDVPLSAAREIAATALALVVAVFAFATDGGFTLAWVAGLIVLIVTTPILAAAVLRRLRQVRMPGSTARFAARQLAGVAMRCGRAALLAALPVAIGILALGAADSGAAYTRATYVPEQREDWALVSKRDDTGSMDPRVATSIRERFPGASIADLAVANTRGLPAFEFQVSVRCTTPEERACEAGIGGSATAYVGDDSLLRAIGVPNARRPLDKLGVIVLSPEGSGRTDVTLEVFGKDSVNTTSLTAAVVRLEALDSGEVPRVVVSPRVADEIGAVAQPTGTTLVADPALGRADARDELAAAVARFPAYAVRFEVGPNVSSGLRTAVPAIIAGLAFCLGVIATRALVAEWRKVFLVLDALDGGRNAARVLAVGAGLAIGGIATLFAIPLARIGGLALISASRPEWPREFSALGVLAAAGGFALSISTALFWPPPVVHTSSELRTA